MYAELPMLYLDTIKHPSFMYFLKKFSFFISTLEAINLLFIHGTIKYKLGFLHFFKVTIHSYDTFLPDCKVFPPTLIKCVQF